jgi:hypothetical protein
MKTLLVGLAVCLLLAGCQNQEQLPPEPKKAPVETPGFWEETFDLLKQRAAMHRQFRLANEQLRKELERGDPDPPPEPPPEPPPDRPGK